jgi:phosphoglucomutase
LLTLEPAAALADIIAAADQIAGLKQRTGRDGPDVIT